MRGLAAASRCARPENPTRSAVPVRGPSPSPMRADPSTSPGQAFGGAKYGPDAVGVAVHICTGGWPTALRPAPPQRYSERSEEPCARRCGPQTHSERACRDV